MVARNRVVVSGSLAGGIEQWSAGLTYGGQIAGGLVDTPGELTVWADAIMDYFRTGSPGVVLRTFMSEAVSIDSVSTYLYPPSGPATFAGQSTGEAVQGTTNTSYLPPQCAVTTTLLTGISGRSYRGRSYWPLLALTIGPELTLNASQTADIAQYFAAFFDYITEVAPAEDAPTLGVYSPTLNQVTTVTSIAVGSVIDTQRRRREGFNEVYANSVYPPV